MIEDRPDYTEGTFIFDALDVWGKYQQIGLAELAVRLGCVSRYRRTGSVIWLDDMEHTPMKWNTYKEHSSAFIGYTNEAADMGGQSIKLTDANVVDKETHIIKYIPTIPKGKAGYELAVAFGSGNYEFYILYDLCIGSTTYNFGIKYNNTDYKIYVYTYGGVWTYTGEIIRLWNNTSLFHNLKIVVDVDTYDYVKAYIDADEIDLSGYTPEDTYNFPESLGIWLAATAGIYSKEVTQRSLYIDNVILTEME